MGFQVSPGVNVSEIDLTTIVPTASTTEGAFAGNFSWGPVMDIQLIESELDLVEQFGKPTDSNFVSFFTAANFLAYGNKLRLVRVVGAGALNATAEATTGSGTPGTGALIDNEEDYLNNFSNGLANIGPFAAKYAGVKGNSLRVSICPSATAYSQNLLAVSSSGTTLSIASGFNAALEPGSIIRNSAGLERTIVSVTNDTTAVLNEAFPVNLAAETVTAKWQYSDAIRFIPGTSAYVGERLGSNDEVNVIVVDEDGLFTGQANSVLERFPLVSLARDAKKEDGTSNYYVDVLNRNSQYVWWTDHVPAGVNWGSTAAGTVFTNVTKPESYSLAGGADGAAPTNSNKLLGFDLFRDSERVDISFVLGGDADAVVATYLIGNICEYRKDCIAVLSPQLDDVVGNVNQEAEDIISFRNNLPSSSYAVLDSGWKYQYDKYNDVYRWVPLNGDIGGLMVRTDTERDAWWSPAGFNRGNIKNVVKLAYNPNKADRDDLYQQGINPVVAFPGQGTVLFGDKTLLAKPSAFDRINVRRLFIVLEKTISRAAKFTLFEFNDEFTRAQFKSLVEPFLRLVQSRRGIYEFYVVCDSRNNTPEVIDRNEFVGDIYIKPARSINFIQLNFIAVRTGVEFNEVIGKF
jgi:hypothetical protein